ncbi:MAG: AGE family epimerase/isomerase [Acidobacteriia bacterium]|nr:AGE family epimerase/isomerase [Terriglobia bacterium]
MFLRSLVGLSLCIAAGAQDDSVTRLRARLPQLKKNLEQNIVPFWYPKTLDRANGGYIINHDAAGNPTGEGHKMIVTQARQVWLFARLARSGYRRKEMLDAAELGYRFLKDKMWDKTHGGFYWEVDATGNKVDKPHKHLYGQSFALYAIAEYALAGKRADVLAFAKELFHLLEAKSHDARYGGYVEFFSRDWSAPPAAEQPYMGGGATGLKLMNTHLHLLESMTTFYRASQLPLARERLLELIHIESNSVVRKGLGSLMAACTDKYERDWTPRLDGNNARVSYGHDLENIWLLSDAMQAAGISPYPFVDLFQNLFSYSKKFGYDEANGGFFDSGAFSQLADRREKVWWTQAEALVSALTMFQLTGKPEYVAVFEKTLDFVDQRQTDWKTGEWHPSVTAAGVAQGAKAQRWKAGYHNGRAMIECIERIGPMQVQ